MFIQTQFNVHWLHRWRMWRTDWLDCRKSTEMTWLVEDGVPIQTVTSLNGSQCTSGACFRIAKQSREREFPSKLPNSRILNRYPKPITYASRVHLVHWHVDWNGSELFKDNGSVDKIIGPVTSPESQPHASLYRISVEAFQHASL